MSGSVRETFFGNGLLVICCIFYLAWWLVAFRPNVTANKAVCTILLVFAFAAGLSALYAVIHGMNALIITRKNLPALGIAGGGALLYLLLLILTWLILKRQITSELFLIVGWAVLEISLFNAYYGTGSLSLSAAVVLSILVGIIVIVSMACYITYYHLDAKARYINGMIPLITIAVFLCILLVYTYQCFKKL